MPRPGFIRRAQHWLRQHWLITALLLLAAGLRAVVQYAYRPALIFPDSLRYLQFAQRFASGHWSPDTIRQSGYSILIIPAAAGHVLALIPLAQHVLGLAEGAMIYAVLVHRGARHWLAALAAVPVLFDPLQLDLEQYVLSDVCAAFFVLTALVILVWRGNQAGRAAMSASGLLLGAAVVTRVADLVLIVPAALYLAVTIRPWRRLAACGGILAAGFLLPVAGYAGWFASSHGQWGLTSYNGTFLYGRVVTFADCTSLQVPAYERPLCPAQPPAQRNFDFYMWSVKSPQWRFQPPHGMTRQAVVLDFSRRVLAHQPLELSGCGRHRHGIRVLPRPRERPRALPGRLPEIPGRFPAVRRGADGAWHLRAYRAGGPAGTGPIPPRLRSLLLRSGSDPRGRIARRTCWPGRIQAFPPAWPVPRRPALHRGHGGRADFGFGLRTV